jgi:hypothetical protein
MILLETEVALSVDEHLILVTEIVAKWNCLSGICCWRDKKSS